MIQHVALEIRLEDAQACARFWTLLGFEREELPPALADRAMWVRHGQTAVHLLFADDSVVPPAGHVAVVVGDYEGTLEALRADGFELEPGREYWGSPRCFMHCPAGHRVEVMEFAPG